MLFFIFQPKLMTKSELRKKYRVLRRQLSQKQVDDYSLAISNQLLQLDIWDREFYHIFLPIEKHNEVNTEFVLNILSGKDKHIVVSKSNFEDCSMKHYLLTDATKFSVNSYGIPEPIGGIPIATEQIDVVFVPLLAYDKKGNRVGYGKGFYDRFLAECRPNVLKIGLSFFDPEDEINEVGLDDVKLDFCVTLDSHFQF